MLELVKQLIISGHEHINKYVCTFQNFNCQSLYIGPIKCPVGYWARVRDVKLRQARQEN